MFTLFFQITEDGCGKTKTCFSVPEACTSSSDCDYLVTYKATADDIEFELASKSSKWVAIGFNDDAEMVSSPSHSQGASERPILVVFKKREGC